MSNVYFCKKCGVALGTGYESDRLEYEALHKCKEIDVLLHKKNILESRKENANDMIDSFKRQILECKTSIKNFETKITDYDRELNRIKTTLTSKKFKDK